MAFIQIDRPHDHVARITMNRPERMNAMAFDVMVPLKKVLDGVPMSLAEFFTLDLGTPPQTFFSADELVELGSDEVSLRLLAAQRPGRQLTILHERYAAGAGTGDEMIVHRGEEGGVVVRGRLEVTVAGNTRVLGPGEGYYFASQLPHRFRNVGRETCEIISANTPPSF